MTTTEQSQPSASGLDALPPGERQRLEARRGASKQARPVDPAGLIGLALRADRWWLLFAAGLQVAVVLTHFAALGPAFIYNWTAVTVRLATWIALLIVLLASAYEAHLVRRYRLLPGAPA